MANVFDVAKYILEKQGQMSTWKLQKLCYYSQAWTLAWEYPPLFDEDFEAWSNGPVCPALYAQHRGKFLISADEFPYGYPSALASEEKRRVDIVLKAYGDRDAYWLREQTHGETPWKNARGNTEEGASCNTVITKASMAEYYASL